MYEDVDSWVEMLGDGTTLGAESSANETFFADVVFDLMLNLSLIPEGLTGGMAGVESVGVTWLPFFVPVRKGFSDEDAGPSKSATKSELSRDGKDGSM